MRRSGQCHSALSHRFGVPTKRFVANINARRALHKMCAFTQSRVPDQRTIATMSLQGKTLMAVLAVALVPAAHAATLVTAARVHTIDDARPHADAFVIGDDGRIAA